MGDDFEQALPAIAAVGAVAIDVGLVALALGTGGLATPLAIAGFALTGTIVFAATSFLVSGTQTAPPEFSPSGMGGSAGPAGITPGSKSFGLTGDSGFRRTSTGPQSPRAIIVGTYMVSGALLDVFLLGTNNRRQFSVVGIGKAPLTNNRVLVDDIDITTLPGFIDVTAGGTPDDNKPWMQFIRDGGAAGEKILANSGKKSFGLSAGAGETIVTPEIHYFNVVSGKSETRIFLSVDAPDVYVDFLETSNADYTGLDGLTLIVDHVRPGTVVVLQETVTFTVVEVDATTVAARINLQTTEVTATVVNVDEIRIESDNDDNKLLKFAGTAFDQFNILQQNYGAQISYTLSRQKKDSSTLTTIISETDRDIEEIINGQAQRTIVLTGLERLETSGAAFALNGLDLDVTVAGTIRTVTFTAAETDAATTVDKINTDIGAWVTASVINTDEIRIVTATGGLSVGGAANAQLNFSVVDGDFFVEESIPSSGFWSFVLEVSKATNGASVNIAIIEVMSDFIETENGVFSDITTQTLIIEINDGTQQTITFGGGTNTAALAIIDINTQLGTSVLASASGSEILIEALASPVGTRALPEVKQLKVIGGTAASAMNFKSIYSETKEYDYDDAYAIINLIADNRISGNPRFTFESTGASTNPAQNLLDIFEGNGDFFAPGLNIRDEIDRASFLNSIAFCDTEGLQSNMAILDPSSGEVIQALKEAGSLILLENGGRYTLIPETDSQPAAELYVTDDFKLDGIIRDSWSGVTIDETRKFNVLRITYPDEEEEYIQRDIIIDITGEVDTENNVKPQIIEQGVLVNIADSRFDSIRASTRNLPAVTSRSQALRLGIQIFKKQNLGNIVFIFSVSIRHYFLEIGDIISLFIDELGFNGKQFRILGIKENNDLGFMLQCSEHFPEMYQ